MAKEPPFLDVQMLTKSFGALTLFENISFSVAAGQKVGLIAKNGTGKSTLLSLIAGKDSPDSGSIIFRNNITVGFLEQTNHFDPKETVIDACFNHQGEDEKILKAKQILTKLKIGDLNQQMGQLSGGQQKRVALANVLITEPDMLIRDEPTNHLDIKYQLEVLDIVKELGCTTLCALHDLNLAAQYCDRLYILNNGKIITEGTPEDVITENMIENIYGVKSSVSRHPETGLLNVVYYPGHVRRTG